MEPIVLKNKDHNLKGTVKITGSKAISNRLLLMEALSFSEVHFNNLSHSHDTEVLRFYLSFFDTCANSRIAMIVDTGNAGAVMRFIMAYAAIREGKWLITGHERLKEHTIQPLVDALRSLGADIVYTEKEGAPPVKINGKPLKGGEVAIDAQQSSHFVSALMLIAPYMSRGLTIHLKGKPVSKAYLEMTAQLIKQSDVDIQMENDRIIIKPGDYNLKAQTIEADWNNAAYWYQMAAFSDESDLFIEDLKKESIQGEKVLAEFFQQFGVETTFSEKGIRLTKIPFETKEFSFDFTNTPDLAIPAIVTCAGMNIPGKFTGINKERLKENSRIETLENELKKLGASLTYQNNSILLEPGTFSASELELEADNDHKLAMSFAPLSKKVQTLKLFSPGTVKKSYPHFWKDINNFGIRVTIPEGICS